MSRIENLKKAYDQARANEDAHWESLELFAVDLASRFSAWLQLNADGSVDPQAPEVPVSVFGVRKGVSGESEIGSLEIGREDRQLNVLLRFDVSSTVATSPENYAAFLFQIGRDDDGVFIVVEGSRLELYSSALYDRFFATLCINYTKNLQKPYTK